MGYLDFCIGVGHCLWKCLLSIEEVLPPYRYAEGHLLAKETGQNDKHYIVVQGTHIEVDGLSFEVLAVGEDLKVRYTRRGRAINIDRVVPPANGAQ